jgi:hypothetical protein
LTWIDGSKRKGAKLSVVPAILQKVLFAIFAVILFLILLPKLDVSLLGDEEWLKTSPLWWIVIANQVCR